jgi:hypothetical protein
MIGLNLGLLAMLLVIVTASIHCAVTIVLMRVAGSLAPGHFFVGTTLARVGLVLAMALLLFFVGFVEALLWALAYLGTGAIEGFEPALYFSMLTFTTLGYGDITLSEDWRLLSTVQASIGTSMFGWSTALIMVLIQRIVSLMGMRL